MMADVGRGGAAVNLGLVDVVFLGCGRDLGFGRNNGKMGVTSLVPRLRLQ